MTLAIIIIIVALAAFVAEEWLATERVRSASRNGRWRIVEMDVWDKDFLDLVETAHLTFKGAAEHAAPVHFWSTFARLRFCKNYIGCPEHLNPLQQFVLTCRTFLAALLAHPIHFSITLLQPGGIAGQANQSLSSLDPV
jgi:hypothetical protein